MLHDTGTENWDRGYETVGIRSPKRVFVNVE
jgi:hypothetical protein